MRFTALSAATLAFVASVFAQTADFDALTTPLKGEQVPVGQTYTVKWLPGKYTTGTATLTLLGGADDKTLLDLGSIGQANNGAGEFAWTVAANLGDEATYGIKITLDSDPTIFQYSFPFQIAGSKAPSSSAGYPVSPVPSSSTYAATSAPSSSYPASATHTISLSSASSNATTSSSAASSTYSASSFPTLTPSSNGTVSATRAPTSFTSLTSARTSSAAATASSTSSSPSTVPTGAAPRVAAGSIALLSGLAAAVFAL